MARLNALLLLVFFASLGVHAVTGRDLTRRNFEVMPEMSHPVAYHTYAPNPNFVDGKTLQPPEPGTIARGFLPLHYRVTPEEAIRAGKELHNPFASTDERAASAERSSMRIIVGCATDRRGKGTARCLSEAFRSRLRY